MKVRIERKLNLKCAAMTELYVDGKREYVSEITAEMSVDIPVHRDAEKIWVEFEADVEIEEIEAWFGVCRIAKVRNIHDCV